MNFEVVQNEPIHIVGVKHRTTNENKKAMQEIPVFWSKFIEEKTIDLIPNKTGSELYALYTNFEDGRSGAYDIIIGSKVSSLEDIPDGLVGITIPGGTYAKVVAKGALAPALLEAWQGIWADENLIVYDPLQVDYEVYGEKAQNPEDVEVPIFLTLNK